MLNSILVDVFNSFWDVKLSGTKVYNKQITFIFLCLAPLIFPAINGHRLVFSGQSAIKLAFNNKRTMHNELSLEFEREIVDIYGELTISNSCFYVFFFSFFSRKSHYEKHKQDACECSVQKIVVDSSDSI